MRTGEIISNLRKDRKWSQADLAEKTGISQVMVGKYERGDAAPSIEVAKNIADSFEVSLDYLVGKTTSISFDKKTFKPYAENVQLPAVPIDLSYEGTVMADYASVHVPSKDKTYYEVLFWDTKTGKSALYFYSYDSKAFKKLLFTSFKAKSLLLNFHLINDFM